jgi:hypothetical protein
MVPEHSVAAAKDIAAPKKAQAIAMLETSDFAVLMWFLPCRSKVQTGKYASACPPKRR